MPLAPANALTREMAWSDFRKEERSPPSMGEFVIAAQTAVGWIATPTNLNVKAVKGRKPAVYKLEKEPTATVQLDKAQMWVASFVFDWSQAKQDALLGHEQIHYLIGALSARDYSNEFAAIGKKEYDSAQAGIDDISDALTRNSKAKAQELQDAYDDATGSNPASANQAKWATAVLAAKTGNKPLRATLIAAGLIKS